MCMFLRFETRGHTRRGDAPDAGTHQTRGRGDSVESTFLYKARISTNDSRSEEREGENSVVLRVSVSPCLPVSDAIASFSVNDIITDFGIGSDRIGLTDGLTEASLTLEDVVIDDPNFAGTSGTMIRIAASGDLLGVVGNITSSELSGNFLAVDLGILSL